MLEPIRIKYVRDGGPDTSSFGPGPSGSFPWIKPILQVKDEDLTCYGSDDAMILAYREHEKPIQISAQVLVALAKFFGTDDLETEPIIESGCDCGYAPETHSLRIHVRNPTTNLPRWL